MCASLPPTQSAHSCKWWLSLGCLIFHLQDVACAECHTEYKVGGTNVRSAVAALVCSGKSWRHTTPPPTLSVEKRTSVGDGGGDHTNGPLAVSMRRGIEPPL